MLPSLLILSLLTLLPSESLALFSAANCQQLELRTNASCRCTSPLTNVMLINCYVPQHLNVSAEFHYGSSLTFNCHSVAEAPTQLSALPQLALGAVDSLELNACDVPQDTNSLSTIFDKWQTKPLNSLKYAQSKMYDRLRRHHFADWPQLKKLQLSDNNLSSIPADLFSALPQLQVLGLVGNQLQQLPVDTFDKLAQLIVLDLSNNSLRHMPVELLATTKLFILKLPGNQLGYAPLNFSHFESIMPLMQLDLSFNGISMLAMDTFEGFKNLRLLWLRGNALRELPEQLFTHNRLLHELNLSYNRLETIAEDLFLNLSKLGHLTLASNALTQLPLKLLNMQAELYHLDLSANELSTLPEGLFAGSRKLKTLILSHNRLTNITREIFSPLSQLEELHLAHNRLVEINFFAFTQTTRLFFLYLEHNQLSCAEDNVPFRPPISLYSLQLRNNSFRNFTRLWFTYARNINLIDLSENLIGAVKLKDLAIYSSDTVTIDLSRNNITTLDLAYARDDFRPLKDNTVLVELEDNPLHCDCRLLEHVLFLRGKSDKYIWQRVRLNTKTVRCQQPTHLRARLVHNLMPLELTCQLQLSECPPKCSCWRRSYDDTLIVNCTHAQLSVFPASLPDPRALALKQLEVDISHNHLNTLPTNDSVPLYALITKLFAAHNHINTTNASQLPAQLTLLDLSYNRLQRLSTPTLQHLNSSLSLWSLFLSHNPWLCDCPALSLLEFSKTAAQSRLRDLSEMQCTTAPHAHKRLQALSLTDICPPNHTLLTFMSVFSVLGFLIGIALALYYRYQLELKIWLYAKELCLCCVTEAELDREKIFDAFVSYSHKDLNFLAEHLVPGLEHGPQPFRLCIDTRNWLVGAKIPDQIMRSVENSRRIIIILSQNFIESVWAQMEFRAAHQSALNEGRTRVIIIYLSEVDDIDSIDPLLGSYLKIHTYLRWNDPRFWSKLRYAMPHSKRQRSNPTDFEMNQLDFRLERD